MKDNVKTKNKHSDKNGTRHVQKEETEPVTDSSGVMAFNGDVKYIDQTLSCSSKYCSLQQWAFVALIGLLSVLAGLSAYMYPFYFMQESPVKAMRRQTVSTAQQQQKNADATKSVEFQHHELYTSKTFDFNEALKQREEAMKKYSFPYSLDGVDKRSNLSLEEFRDVYDGKWPVIVTDVVPNWPASNWTTDLFLEEYSEERVLVLHAGPSSREGFGMSLDSFIGTLDHGQEDAWTYLQDEVFLLQHPELRAQVSDTVYSDENFFKLFPKDLQPWDCMLLWGAAHSRSHLHIDPYNWTGTNAVISGLKMWKLLPPGQDEYIHILSNSTCGFPLDCWKYDSELDLFSPKADVEGVKKLIYLEVDQLPGEMLFIPTGWFHQAFNAVPTLAVSGQFMNAMNYKVILEEIFIRGQISRSVLPEKVNEFTPEKLVAYIMKQVPKAIIENGAKWTERVLHSLNYGSGE